MRTLNGAWSYSWQGELTDKFAGDFNTIFEALANKYGKDNVKYVSGVSYKENGSYYDMVEDDIVTTTNTPYPSENFETYGLKLPKEQSVLNL